MDRAVIRKLPWPEVTLLASGVLLILFFMFMSSSHSCHQWREQLERITGAYLASAGEEEYPRPGPGNAQDNEGLEKATARLLDERPFGCL